MMQTIMGIDPGMSGGIAVIESLEDRSGFRFVAALSLSPPKAFTKKMRDAKMDWLRNRGIEFITMYGVKNMVVGIEKPFIPTKEDKENICPAFAAISTGQILRMPIKEQMVVTRLECSKPVKREVIGNPYDILAVGETVGMWGALCRTHTRNIYKVVPRSWQKMFNRPPRSPKRWAVDLINNSYNIGKKLLVKDHNQAEAILITLYIAEQKLHIPGVLK